MHKHAHALVDLTRNQSMVMTALTRSQAPMSAYAILNQLRAHAFRAPLQVYRALDKLGELGLAHRLESLNAFIACTHPECDGDDSAAFMICETCGQVNEIKDGALCKRQKQLAAAAGFVLTKSTVELRGICRNCQAV